jgi:hypothetical protein
MNDSCYFGLSDELNLHSAARILVAWSIQGRLLIDCRRVRDIGKGDFTALSTVSSRSGVLLSHVAPHVAPQPQQTLGAEHLDSIETPSNNWSVEGAGCSRNVSGEAGIANYRYFESPKFAEIARPGPAPWYVEARRLTSREAADFMRSSNRVGRPPFIF